MRMLHTMLRVGDLDRSVAFYTEVLGMKVLHRKSFPEGEFTNAFVGYDDIETGTVLELTYNWGVDGYELGTAFGHIAVGVDDVYATCDKIAAAGGNIVRPAGPMKGGTKVLAFVKDPDGYMIEVVEDIPEE